MESGLLSVRAWRWEEPALPWIRESPSMESGLRSAVALPSAGTLRLWLV